MIQAYQKDSKSRIWFKKKLREALTSFSSFNKLQKSELFNEFCRLAFHVENIQMRDLDKVIKLINKYDRKLDYNKKKHDLQNMIKSDEVDTAGKGYPVIFYACSKHNKAATDHVDHQGKLYVDRFWKYKLVSHGTPEWLIKTTEKVIRREGYKTIQEIMGYPVYLGTRPNCRHFFIQVDLLSGLTMSEDVLAPDMNVRARRRTADKINKEIKKELGL
jgi:hypothetical protein